MIDFALEFQYAEEQTPTLQKVEGNVPAGRCVVLCGGSGCGKTTLGKLIAGLCKPSGGQITLFSKPQKPKQLQSQVLFIMQDAESLARCAALIRDMRKEKTVLIITHDLELIAMACDRCRRISKF